MQTFTSTINSANDDESNAYDCHRATCLANVLLQLDTRLPRLGHSVSAREEALSSAPPKCPIEH